MISFDKAHYSRTCFLKCSFCNAMFKDTQNACNWFGKTEKDDLSCDDADAESETNIELSENSSLLKMNNFL